MADHTGIEWTDATWNPIVGCTIVSPGCTNCYAMKQANRLLDGNPNAPHYAGTTRKVNGQAVWTGKVALAPEHILTQPLRWSRPRRIFVNSMGDLFHEDVPDEWIDQVFAVMALAPQHTFQVLTKRSGRMRHYLTAKDVVRRVFDLACDLAVSWKLDVTLIARPEHEQFAPAGPRVRLYEWPRKNVWLGVSAEDQQRAEERIPDLIETPAAVRFVSAEPLLGLLDLTEIDINGDGEMNALAMRTWAEIWAEGFDPAVTGTTLEDAIESFEEWGGTYPPTDIRPRGIDWVIVGGESGPDARPMHPDWARDLRDQCTEAGVAFHFKQWGSNVPDEARAGRYRRVPKKEAGRMLDGVEHNAFPRSAA